MLFGCISGLVRHGKNVTKNHIIFEKLKLRATGSFCSDSGVIGIAWTCSTRICYYRASAEGFWGMAEGSLDIETRMIICSQKPSAIPQNLPPMHDNTHIRVLHHHAIRITPESLKKLAVARSLSFSKMIWFLVIFSPWRTRPEMHPKSIGCSNRCISELRRAVEAYFGSRNVDLAVIYCKYQIFDRRKVFGLSVAGYMQFCRFHTITQNRRTW